MKGKRGEGAAAEEAACRWLKGQGCEILARNLYFEHGEIDILLRDGEYLVFAEVKMRSEKFISRYGRPSAAVNPEKERHLRDAANEYLRSHPTSLIPRIDVIEAVRTELPGGWVSFALTRMCAASRRY